MLVSAQHIHFQLSQRNMIFFLTRHNLLLPQVNIVLVELLSFISMTIFLFCVQAMFELITSEASYYKSLEILEIHFLRNASLINTLSQSDMHFLFSNIEEVMKASERQDNTNTNRWSFTSYSINSRKHSFFFSQSLFTLFLRSQVPDGS